MVGRLFCANSAYAAASYQLTPPTGKSAFPSGKFPNCQVDGPGRPVASRKSATACFQGRIRPSLTKGSFQYCCFWYPPASTNSLNWRFVTSYLSSQNSETAAKRAGNRG